jgi:hypothetical protein
MGFQVLALSAIMYASHSKEPSQACPMLLAFCIPAFIPQLLHEGALVTIDRDIATSTVFFILHEFLSSRCSMAERRSVSAIMLHIISHRMVTVTRVDVHQGPLTIVASLDRQLSVHDMHIHDVVE